MLKSCECDTGDQAGIHTSAQCGMLASTSPSSGFSCWQTFNVPIKPLKHTTNSRDEPEDTFCTSPPCCSQTCGSAVCLDNPVHLEIMSILDVFAPHNLCPMPTFSAKAVEIIGVEDAVADGCVTCLTSGQEMRVCILLQTYSNCSQ